MNKREKLELKTCSVRSPCPNCESNHGNIFPSTGVHIGFIRCASCERFLKWVSKSEFERAIAMNLVNDDGIGVKPRYARNETFISKFHNFS